jgi:methionyl-tRNA formyltransferase
MEIDVYLGGVRGYLAWRNYFSSSRIKNTRFFFLNTPGELFDITKEIKFEDSNQVVLLNSAALVSDYSKSKVAICIGWRYLLRADYEQVLVVHDSLLPRFRGWNPLVTCLQLGEREIGMTLFVGDDEIDAGQIVNQIRIILPPSCTIRHALEMLSVKYSDLFDPIFEDGKLTSFKTVPQEDSDVTYSIWRDELDYRIDWNRGSSTLERFVNSLGWPYCGAQTRLFDKTLYIVEAVALEHDLIIENRSPGKVIKIEKDGPVVVCGSGLLKLKKVLDSNRQEISFENIRTRFM